MSIKRYIGSLAAIPGSLLLTETAFAHPGHGTTGFVAGLVHPLTGVDHLAAMIIVGYGRGWRFPATGCACRRSCWPRCWPVSFMARAAGFWRRPSC